MTYYLYLSAIGEWTRPPKGTTEKQLIACYRHVRKIQAHGRNSVPVMWWDDGQLKGPRVPTGSQECRETIASLRARGIRVVHERRRR
jgi:hypothetical protein